MQSVGLLEAWGLWWQGKSVQGMSLWGTLPMLVVGRAGKIMAFIGSVVAVIDIIGPDRIRQWASRTQSIDIRPIVVAILHKRSFKVIMAVILIALAWPLSDLFGRGAGIIGAVIGATASVLGTVAVAFVPRAVEAVVKRIARVLEDDRWELAVRWSGFMLIIVGFSLDLLAS